MKWEYLILISYHGLTQWERVLSEHGELGWELVAVTTENDEQHSMAYFKRPKKEA